MADDPLLSALGKMERAEQAVPERWRALVEGRATPEQIAALEEEARGGGEAAVLWERFRPLDTGQEQELAGRLVERVRGDVRARRRRAAAAGAGMIAAAAVVWFAMWLPPALPRYRLEVGGGDLPQRGALAGRVEVITEYHPQSALVLILRPERLAETAVAVDGYIVRDGRAVVWSPPMEVSATGAVRIDGTVAALLPEVSGDATLLLFVRRAEEAALAPEEALVVWGSGTGRVLAHEIRVKAGGT